MRGHSNFEIARDCFAVVGVVTVAAGLAGALTWAGIGSAVVIGRGVERRVQGRNKVRIDRLMGVVTSGRAS